MDKRKANILIRLHLTLMGALLLLIISTPFLVKEGFSVFDEEVVESTMILFLIGLSLSVSAFYRREISRKERSLAEFTRHVGTLNLQIEQIRLLSEISNRRLAEAKAMDGYSVICSGQDYLHLKAFCVLPVKDITRSQSLLIRVILDNLSMLYVVLTTAHYQEP